MSFTAGTKSTATAPRPFQISRIRKGWIPHPGALGGRKLAEERGGNVGDEITSRVGAAREVCVKDIREIPASPRQTPRRVKGVTAGNAASYVLTAHSLARNNNCQHGLMPRGSKPKTPQLHSVAKSSAGIVASKALSPRLVPAAAGKRTPASLATRGERQGSERRTSAMGWKMLA